jgi:opacity protein-like surface antigen
MMKNILGLTLLALYSTSTYAEGLSFTPYIEGSIGFFDSEKAEVGAFKYDNGNPVTSTSIFNHFDSTANYSVEVGLKDILPNLRVGISDTFVRLKTHTIGTITSYNSGYISRYENEDKGHSSTNIMMVNAYYHFPVDYTLKPYVGLGLGAYKNNQVLDTEFAWSLVTGANYNINDHIYAGGKVTYYRLNEATASSQGNNTIAEHNAYTFNLVLGYNF